MFHFGDDLVEVATDAAGRFETVLTKPDGDDDTEEYSITITGDYTFNKNLVVRGEARWDLGIDGKYANAGDQYFEVGDYSDTQTLLTFEVIYKF